MTGHSGSFRGCLAQAPGFGPLAHSAEGAAGPLGYPLILSERSRLGPVLPSPPDLDPAGVERTASTAAGSKATVARAVHPDPTSLLMALAAGTVKSN